MKAASILLVLAIIFTQVGVVYAQGNSNPVGFVQNMVCSFTGWWCPAAQESRSAGLPATNGSIPAVSSGQSGANLGSFINLSNIFSPTGLGRIFSGFLSLFGRSGGVPSASRQVVPSGVTTGGGGSTGEPGSNLGALGELEMLCTGSNADISYCNDLFNTCIEETNGCAKLDEMCNSSQANLDYCRLRGYFPKSGSIAVPSPRSVLQTPAPVSGGSVSDVISSCVGISVSNQSALPGCISYCSGANESRCLERIRTCKSGKVSGGDCSSFANAASACCGFFKLPDCSKLTNTARNALCSGK